MRFITNATTRRGGDTIDDKHEFTGSVDISGSLIVNGSEVGIAPGPNTFDFNLDPEAAGTVNFIEDSTGNTQAISKTTSGKRYPLFL